MAEPHIIKGFHFDKTQEELFRLRGVGYNDFRVIKGWNLFRTLNNYTIHFVRNGKGTLCIYDREYSVKAGDMFFIPPGETISYYPDEAEPWRYYWYTIQSSTAALEIAGILGFCREVPVRTMRAPETVTELLDTLFAAEGGTVDVYYQALATLMQILSAEHVTVYRDVKRPCRREMIAEEVKDIIRLNCTNPDFSVDDIAQMLFMSHAHMCRQFKAETGTTPIAYLTGMRLDRAAMLLKEQAYSVQELCEASGFRDEAHFMKQFKKKFGTTVKGYRKTLQS